ncbi:MAG TPA: recombination protein RecR [Bacteroidales bacterium]|nr:recombination protein RecR [Bacteroidales bacterium]
METFSSKLLQAAVEEFSRLPGIGKKTALRLVLHLLKQDAAAVSRFSESIERLRREVVYCKQCFNISEKDICEICRSPRRDTTTICVVEDLRDIIAIENTGQYHGLYHILGGVISPIEGVGPNDLHVGALLERIANDSTNLKEIILALSTTMEGDTTNFYLYRKIQPMGVNISVIARGIAIGNEIEYADEVTLGRSILNRTPYENLITK